MVKDPHPRNQLQNLLTPATGEDLDKLVDELVGPAEHADREVPDKPLFFKAAEARAARRGISADQLLADYTARLELSTYPSLDCLLPEEVQQISEGQPLTADQEQHVASCAPCRQLLDAAQLPRERREALLRDVASLQTPQPVEVTVVDQRESTNAAAQVSDTPARAVEQLVGTSEAIRAVGELIGKVAPTASAVLIEGESGTGKDLVAMAVHRLSPRADRPFIALNFAALPAELVEAELFGYEKGAFVGASAMKAGRIAAADSGTLFLKAIDAVPVVLQPRLLRFLQEMEFQPVGTGRPKRVDVRVIAATNRDLRQLLQTGEFREDLYYRLSIMRITVPPLRDRAEDIPALVEQFVAQDQRKFHRQMTVSSEVIDALLDYSWPGNVRELKNVLERAIIMNSSGELTLADLGSSGPGRGARQPMADALDEAERQRLVTVLRQAKGRLRGPQGAADRLGLEVEVLLGKLNKLGISVPKITEKS